MNSRKLVVKDRGDIQQKIRDNHNMVTHIRNREGRLRILQRSIYEPYDGSLTLLNFRVEKNFVSRLRSLSNLIGNENRTETIRRIVSESFNTHYIQELSRLSVPVLKEVFEHLKLRNVELGNPLSRNRDEETLLTFNYQTTQLRFEIPKLFYWCNTKFYRANIQTLLLTLDMNNPSEVNAEIFIPQILSGPEIDPLVIQKVFTLAAQHKLTVQSKSSGNIVGGMTKKNKTKEEAPLLILDLSSRFTFNPCVKDWKSILKTESKKFKDFLKDYTTFLNKQTTMIKMDEEKEDLPESIIHQMLKYIKKLKKKQKKDSEIKKKS